MQYKEGMKTLLCLFNGSFILGLTLAAIGTTGCATRERVVVREQPRAVIVAQPAVVVERPRVVETVVVH